MDFKIEPRHCKLPQPPPAHNMRWPPGAVKMSFRGLSRNNIYLLVMHSLHYMALATRQDTPWREILPLAFQSHPCWGSLYLYPTPRTMADLSWRLLHGALSSEAMMRHFTNVPEGSCFCGEREAVFHMYLQCRHLQPIFLLIGFTSHQHSSSSDTRLRGTGTFLAQFFYEPDGRMCLSNEASEDVYPSIHWDHTLCRTLVLSKQCPGLLGTILDGFPLQHRIPACRYSFCKPQKDDRLSQPHLALIQQPSRI
uniref:Reverse transcriptase zinc-binding domain-containing protein n=1 Tax=Eptatretus burgeri TaxID=7764 RepID=A0A8C4QH68_EPTBU